MYILGITGNIGSGKSTASGIFQELGAVVSHSDDLAKDLIRTDKDLITQIKAAFGNDIYSENGELQAALLAERAFSSQEGQQELNAIVHPAVRRATRQRISDAEAQNRPLFIIDAPLLFEAGADILADSVLVVAAKDSIRQERVMTRSGIEKSEFERRDALQMPISEKLERASHIIWNDGDLAGLKERVVELYRNLSL